MNKKELNEIRRRFRPDGNSIGEIHTCFISSTHDILATKTVSVGLMTNEETVLYMKLLKKTLSGTKGRNLIDISFSTAQVADSPEHRLLMKLRDSKLGDEQAMKELYAACIAGLPKDDNAYLLMAAFDTYDVPYRSSDNRMQSDAGTEIFPYFVCCACPVKEQAVELRYDIDSREFHTALSSQTVSNPELGFMFPCFDDRSSNIYNALYYVRNQADIHPGFIDLLFKTGTPMTAPEKSGAFSEAIAETVGDQCSLELVQTVQEQLISRIELHKESHLPDDLLLTVKEVGGILKENGIPDEKVEQFSRECTEKLGPDGLMEPGIIMDCKKFEVKTPEIKISVAPENAWMITTRVIDGKKYILIPAENGAEVNGIPVEVTE